MGIAGLWPVLEPCCHPMTLESFEGKKLAVDVSFWIHQADSLEVKAPHLALLFSRLCKLLFYKIRPIFVFEGCSPDLKRKVLNGRRMQHELENNILITSHGSRKRKPLEDLARGDKDEQEVLKNLTSNQKRNKNGDDILFNLPTTSTNEIILSEDDDDFAVEKIINCGAMSKTAEIEKLIDLKEQVRQSRLHPDMIPSNTDDFCQFQLSRVLGKNNINKAIDKLTKERQNKIIGADVKFAVADTSGSSHIISYERNEDIKVLDIQKNNINNQVEDSWHSLGLTLDHFNTPGVSHNDSRESKDSEEFDYTAIAEVTSRDFLSKSSMIENLMKRRIGTSTTETLREDDWSTDSGDEDFIDVTNDDIKPRKEASETINDSQNAPSEPEWNPMCDEESSTFMNNKNDVQSHERDELNRDPSVKEMQDFLTACGFPWIEAPGEAEAQCVELERLGLVEGVVSDDSDVWAFGAQNVYRYLFSKTKHIQFYNQTDIFKKTALRHPNYIEIALLSGGDYSPGIHGVGIVTAIELIAEFTQKYKAVEAKQEIMSTMDTIKNWILSQSIGEPTVTKRSLRKLIEKNNSKADLQNFFNWNSDIVDAYIKPNVDNSRELFRWKKVQLKELKAIIITSLAWTDQQFEKIASPSFQRWNDFISGVSSYQKHITSHVLVQSKDEQKLNVTKRVATALKHLAQNLCLDPPTLVCQLNFENTAIVPGASKRKTVNAMKGRKRQLVKNKDNNDSRKLNLSESSDSDN